MNRHLSWRAIACLALATGLALAGVASAAPGASIEASYEDFLEWGKRLEGLWTGTITVIADWPGLNKKQGEVIPSHLICRWALDKQALEETETLANSTARRLHYWDAVAKRIKIVSVDTEGETWTATIGRDGDHWHWSVQGSLHDGTEMTGKGISTLTADGNLPYLVDGNLTLGGKELPVLHDVYRKAGPGDTPQSGTPGPGHEHLKVVDWLIGDWKAQGAWADGKPHEGEERLEWYLNGNFIRGIGWYRNRDGQRIDYCNTIAWNPERKQVVMFSVDSQGYHGLRRGDYDSQTKTITCRERGRLGAGEATSYDVVVRLVDNNTIEWIGSEFRIGEEELPDLKFTFSRK